ncbi:MAG: hypothetical protein MK212_19460, partial [Saprospiraceae bacterium]|nr:hypothetical protein [Saprospiraceae bacterium]
MMLKYLLIPLFLFTGTLLLAQIKSEEIHIDAFAFKYMPIHIRSSNSVEILDSNSVIINKTDNLIRINPLPNSRKSNLLFKTKDSTKIKLNLRTKMPPIELTLHNSGKIIEREEVFSKNDLTKLSFLQCRVINFDLELRGKILDFSITTYDNDNKLKSIKSNGNSFSQEQLNF